MLKACCILFVLFDRISLCTQIFVLMLYCIVLSARVLAHLFLCIVCTENDLQANHQHIIQYVVDILSSGLVCSMRGGDITDRDNSHRT